MKKIFAVFSLIVLTSFFVSCVQNPQQQYGQQYGGQPDNSQVVVNEAQPMIGQNLDLQAVGEIIKQCKNPQEIEQRLNSPDQSGYCVNNLDLDGDGNRDYLKVTEYGNGNERNYSITDVQKDGEPEVATISCVVQPNQQIQMTVAGNQQYYGNQNYMYQSNFSTSDFLFWAWLMSPRPYYVSPYHYGYYGYGYYARPIMPYHSYYGNPYMSTVRTKTTYKTVTTHTTTVKSPNVNNTSKITQSHVNLSNPTQSQKSFTVRDNNKPIGTGGFSNKNSSSSYSSSPTKSSSSWGSSSGSSGSNSYSKPSYSSPTKSSSSWGSGSSSSSKSSYSSPSKSSSWGSSSSSKSSSWGSSSSSKSSWGSSSGSKSYSSPSRSSGSGFSSGGRRK